MELFAIAGDFLAVIRKELISADGILVAVRAFLQCERLSGFLFRIRDGECGRFLDLDEGGSDVLEGRQGAHLG